MYRVVVCSFILVCTPYMDLFVSLYIARPVAYLTGFSLDARDMYTMAGTTTVGNTQCLYSNPVVGIMELGISVFILARI